MSAPRFIQKIREKPVHVRERILLISMVIVAILIIAVWLITFNMGAPQSKESAKDSAIVRFGQYIGTSVKNSISAGTSYFSKAKSPGTQ